MKTKIIQNIKSIILALILVVGVSYVSAASVWSDPTAAAPGNNRDVPLNVSSTGQIKAGGLTLNTSGAVNGLIVQNGNVGIGTSTPTQKLDINGNVNVRGTDIRMFNSATNFYGDSTNLAARVSDSGMFYVQNSVGSQQRPLVASQIRAGQYCDSNGANCKTTTEMGGATSGVATYNDLPTGALAGACTQSASSGGINPETPATCGGAMAPAVCTPAGGWSGESYCGCLAGFSIAGSVTSSTGNIFHCIKN